MKVCILAPIHIWSDVRVFSKQAKTFSKQGYDVSLICNVKSEGIVDGIKLISSWTSGRNKFLRIIFSVFIFIQCLKEKADIYHCHNPDTLVAVFMLKILGKTVVYDTHENFVHRILFKDWIPPIFRKPVAYIISRLEKFASLTADHTFVTQEVMLRRFGRKTSVLGNLPVLNEPANRFNLEKAGYKKSKNELSLVYLGLINKYRGIFEILQALYICNVRFDINITLSLIGDVNDELMSDLQESPGWKYVNYYSFLPQDEAMNIVRTADVGLIYIQDVGDHRYTDPNKMYEYMMCKKPFIASDFPDWRIKLNGVHCGWFVKPNDSELLAHTILNIYNCDKSLLEKLGSNGLDYVKINNWGDKGASHLIDVYKRILNS